jgi:hypothetical protein
MSKRRRSTPRLLFAEPDGQIYDHPELLMVCRRGRELTLPRPDALVPLPEGSELFHLPGRRCPGLEPETVEARGARRRAAGWPPINSPGYNAGPPRPPPLHGRPPLALPLFAYGAVGKAQASKTGPGHQDRRGPAPYLHRASPRPATARAPRPHAHAPQKRLVAPYTWPAAALLTYACPSAKNLGFRGFEPAADLQGLTRLG